MNKSPGHKRQPDHKVQEEHVKEHMIVEIDGEVVAESDNVIRLDEDGYPARYYFPRADVRLNTMKRTSTVTECPFKGRANYFSITAGGKNFEDAAWTYEDPYEEHRGLKDRVAFYEGKISEIHVKAA